MYPAVCCQQITASSFVILPPDSAEAQHRGLDCAWRALRRGTEVRQYLSPHGPLSLQLLLQLLNTSLETEKSRRYQRNGGLLWLRRNTRARDA